MEETKPIIDVISTTNSKLSNLPIKDGQLIFVHDSKKIALDYKNARTVYEQIQVLEKESNRTELLAPINSFYFVIETSILWKYHNGQWIQLTNCVTPPPEKYQYSDAIINTLSGESPLVIPDSAERVNKGFGLTGKTEQLNTRGVNLWRSDSTVIVSGTKYLMFDNPIQTGTYTLSAIFANDKSASESLFTFYNEQNQSMGGGTIKQGGRQSKTFTLTGKAVKVLFYSSSGYDSSQGVTTTIKEIQLEKGTTATPYEPYTGGKPAPSPEYPQDIVNAGKLNEDTGKYEVIVDKYGKNLFDKYIALPKSSYDIQSGSYWRKYFYLPPNTKYRVRTFNNSIKPPLSSVGLFLGPVTKNGAYDNADANGIVSLFPSDHYDKNIAFSTDETGKMVLKIVGYANETNVKKMLDNVHIMIYKDGLDDTIEQYIAPKSFTITSDRPITKWDKLVEQDGQIGWLYGGVVVDRFDGQSNKISIANKQGDVQNFSIQFENVPNGNGNSDIFVDKYRAVQLSYTKAEYGICCNWNVGVKYFSAPNENVATVDEFKAWLVENPLKIAYETTKTEFIPLPQSEQNAIRALTTHYPTTVISIDGGGLDPDVEVTYTADTKNYIDNKFAQLQKSLINTQVQLL